jgi:hypothetical protein
MIITALEGSFFSNLSLMRFILAYNFIAKTSLIHNDAINLKIYNIDYDQFEQKDHNPSQ